jgi:SAM-dependent methyltransferase
MQVTLEEPTIRPVDPLCFRIRGWAWGGDRHGDIVAVEAWSDGQLVARSATLYARPDVAGALQVAADTPVGFELFGHHGAAAPNGTFNLAVRLRLRDGSLTDTLAHKDVATIRRDYRTHDFGVLLDSATTAIQHEENIFATGPSQSDPSPELVTLLRRYLGAPPRRLIDVGCGFGSYGRTLLQGGYDWLGVDIDPADCAELERLGLPHRLVDGRTLPFTAGEFDAALCLEVLEHIAEPVPFLAEVHRVAPKQLIVSVPNCELLTYLSPYLATPWHMLESTHVNYFTRWSLGALLRQFYPEVELRFHTPAPLRTVEGTPLYYNLLAIARTP